MILLILTTLPIILIIITYLLHKTTCNIPAKTPVPPGPPGLPLIGNLHQFATAKNIHVYLWKLSKKYGPLMHMKFGPVPVLIISSPQLAKQVLKTQDLSFCGRPRLLGQQKLSYNCMDMAFSPYGSYWRELRKITAVHLFSLKKIQSFRAIREDEIYRMVKKISSFADEVVNLSEIAMAMASTLIFRIAFSKRYDEKGSEIRRFDELLHEAQALMATVFVSDYFPKFSWVDKLTGLINRLNKTFKDLDLLYQEFIDEHLDPKRLERMEENDDILDILIRLKEEKLCSIDLNWDIIKALLMNIFIGSTDTSVASSIWTMTALMKAPLAMKKAQAEIRNSVGKKGKVDEDDLQKLPHLKAVINETLRMYPPAPMLIPRETIEKCVLEGYEIQPKTVVYINGWAIARDPEYWEDPNEFMPERFLNSNIDVKGQDFGVIPFGSGRRICPGMFMGLANMELIVANLLYSFDWEFPPGIQAEDIDTNVLRGLTMHKKNALFLVPRKFVF
ncbi:Cytochrome P450 CYP2 subfamily [Handroanthus impetiginosus]|uniref:Cytochrome P450 CYP2 subfamily n=1 Tax=Handroanthus impetiginosus TaxID=429701 RepID=A0A2G9GFT6_9LAMI|nr:Cytochrome P450 CYP2 subfamily [Handroanthus impetiginosus]